MSWVKTEIGLAMVSIGQRSPVRAASEGWSGTANGWFAGDKRLCENRGARELDVEKGEEIYRLLIIQGFKDRTGAGESGEIIMGAREIDAFCRTCGGNEGGGMVNGSNVFINKDGDWVFNSQTL